MTESLKKPKKDKVWNKCNYIVILKVAEEKTVVWDYLVLSGLFDFSPNGNFIQMSQEYPTRLQFKGISTYVLQFAMFDFCHEFCAGPLLFAWHSLITTYLSCLMGPPWQIFSKFNYSARTWNYRWYTARSLLLFDSVETGNVL